jgi:hypothetical protein
VTQKSAQPVEREKVTLPGELDELLPLMRVDECAYMDSFLVRIPSNLTHCPPLLTPWKGCKQLSTLRALQMESAG